VISRLEAAVAARIACDTPADADDGSRERAWDAVQDADLSGFAERVTLAAGCLELDDLSLDVLWLSAAAELDGRFGDVFGFLLGDQGRRLPTARLVADVLAEDGVQPATVLACLGTHAPLRRRGAVRLADANAEGPLADQAIFNDFADFRSAFWRLVADDPILGRVRRGQGPGWSAANKARMRNGLAPFAGSGGTGGGSNALLQLNHKQALKNAGALYDLDNIEVVTPWFHQRIGI
jgi:hypothetical protein